MLNLNLRLNAAALILSAIISLLLNNLSPLHFSNWFYLGGIFFFFFILSNLLSAHRSKREDFTAFLLLNLSLKLLLAFICIGCWAFFYRSVFLNISLHFVLHFLTFTGFEIRYIYRLIKINSEKKTQNT